MMPPACMHTRAHSLRWMHSLMNVASTGKRQLPADPTKTRLVHGKYRLRYDRSDHQRMVRLTRLADNAEISYYGGRGVTIQTAVALGLELSQRACSSPRCALCRWHQRSTDFVCPADLCA
jgi:hypothetical protein